MEPLASQLRPKTLDDFIGQDHLVGPGKALYKAIQERHIFSFILWGPPGVGKTTLARIYAQALDADLHELSAVSASKSDIRDIVDTKHARQPQLSADADQPTVLFLDEIHRFTKSQQDFLLPYVESGRLVLIGATTENPSFEVIPALLSRCRVFTLHEFSHDAMKSIIQRTGYALSDDAIDWLIRVANGDARQAITIVENTARLYDDQVTIENMEELSHSRHVRYDKDGEEHYNAISAFIKSMRASQSSAALYYLARMVESGEDPVFIARRMVIFASEDIGNAQPTALVVANAVFDAVQAIGMPEAGINLSHGVVYLSEATKDRSAYNAYNKAIHDVKKHGNLPIPMKIRNAPTKLMKDMGYGAEYEKYTDDDFLPEELQGRDYFNNE